MLPTTRAQANGGMVGKECGFEIRHSWSLPLTLPCDLGEESLILSKAVSPSVTLA